MSRGKFIISNFSKVEREYLPQGQRSIYGTSNSLSDICKFIGKYDKLIKEGKQDDILEYDIKNGPISDENNGIIVIRDYVNSEPETEVHEKHLSSMYVSRRAIRHLLRKWGGFPVKISFRADDIIQCIIKYIYGSDQEKLREAIAKYTERDEHLNRFRDYMPLQSDFLNDVTNGAESIRQKTAERIINCIRDTDIVRRRL